jgi:hypothetical protein
MSDISKPIARSVERISLPNTFGDLAALARFLASPVGPKMLEDIVSQAEEVNQGLTASERLIAADKALAEAQTKLVFADARLEAADTRSREVDALYEEKKKEADLLLRKASDDALEIVRVAQEEASAAKGEAEALMSRAETAAREAQRREDDVLTREEEVAALRSEFERRLALVKKAAGDLDGDGVPDTPTE